MRSWGWSCFLGAVIACSHPPKQTQSGVDGGADGGADGATDASVGPVLTVSGPTTFDELGSGPEYNRQTDGAITSAGSRYFMAWVTHGATDVLVAAHFTADGVQVEPAPIVIEVGGGTPQVACTQSGVCAVVWRGGSLKFIRVAADGSGIDTVAATFFDANKALLGATSDHFVVELEVGLGAQAVRFGDSGPPLDATPIAWPGLPTTLGCEASACWTNDGTMGLRRVADDGTTTTFAIPPELTAANGSGLTSISCGAVQCLATANDNSPSERLIGARFGLDGTFVDATPVELFGTPAFGFVIHTAADGASFLVTLLGQDNNGYVVQLASAGATSQEIAAIGSGFVSSLACLATGCLVVASIDASDGQSHIYGVPTLNGVPAATATLLTTAASSQRLPVVGFGNDFLVTWTDERVATSVGRGARWSANGDPIASSEVATPIVERLAWRGDGYLGLTSKGSQAVVLDPGGAVVAGPIPLGYTPVSYDVACSPLGTCMMVFFTGTSVEALPIGSDGSALSAPFMLVTTPQSYFAPDVAIAWLGGHYLAVVAQNGAIDEFPLTPAGVQPGGMVLPVDAQQVRLAPSHGGAFIVWEKYAFDHEGISGANLGGFVVDAQLQAAAPSVSYGTYDRNHVPVLLRASVLADGFAFAWANYNAGVTLAWVDGAAGLRTTTPIATPPFTRGTVSFCGGTDNAAELVASGFSPELEAYRLQLFHISVQ